MRNVFQGRKINQFTITTLNANMLCKFKARDIIYLPRKIVKTNPQVFIGDVKFRKSRIPPPYCSSCVDLPVIVVAQFSVGVVVVHFVVAVGVGGLSEDARDVARGGERRRRVWSGHTARA